ncbi:Leukocyte receptor cluster member 9, variant 2 [Clonorchis sinensis]|uniref:Leukocyte receptor cluster member 9 n=3 Tax=Clonorchis sinensis TaxID=79923 RepID=G7YLU1_CLOSI|nr:Leukocyte receptor cluster member 9, variant 2 [Clonorchis sinensis]GAA53922.1 leukocyte receptor cluster member 9 [Clonorchis sinensis]
MDQFTPTPVNQQDTKKYQTKKTTPDAKKKRSKRTPMRTAMDVVKRIIWDDEVPQDAITIGYEDRFLGVLEKPFEAFSWEPLDSLDYYTFGIPEHRIQYFKYKNNVIWDKRILLDNVFGSQGSGITIHDVIKQQNEAEESYRAANQIDSPECDIEDDGITVWTRTSGDNPRLDRADKNFSDEDSDEDTDDADAYWQNKLRPNFFICHRIDSSEFVEQAVKLQSHMCKREPAFESCCIPPAAYHMTLRTLRLDNAEQVSECVRALKSAHEELQDLLPTEPLSIRGIGNFHGRVVYAAVEPNQQLVNFVDHLDLVLNSCGLRPTDGRDFVPHITLVKLSRPVGRKLQIDRIDPALYEDFIDCSFGSQLLGSIYLCSMEKTRDSEGFYISPAHVTFMQRVV